MLQVRPKYLEDQVIKRSRYPGIYHRIAKELSRRLIQRNALVNTTRDKIRVFIISSAEALDVARTIQNLFAYIHHRSVLCRYKTVPNVVLKSFTFNARAFSPCGLIFSLNSFRSKPLDIAFPLLLPLPMPALPLGLTPHMKNYRLFLTL